MSGTDPAIDSNAGVNGISAPVTLTATTPDVMTLDAGLSIIEKPAISIVKGSALNVGTDALATPGDIITYSYEVSNIGNVALSNVTVTEAATSFTGSGTLPSPSFVSSTLSSAAGSLKVGEKATYTASYAITAADITAGKIDNQAFTAGVSPKNVTVKDTSDSKNPADYNETGTPGTNPVEKDKTGTSIPKNPVGSIGDSVFLDNDGSNTQTTGDSPVVGVKVYLLNSTGVKIDSTTTGTDGKYLFSNLPLGTYSVQFVAPVGQSFVTPNSGTDPAIDSNAGTGGISAPVTLTPANKDVLTIDAGVKATIIPACQKPTLTAGNVVCSGTTYSISFNSNATTVTASAGTISGNSVTGIPVGTNVTMVASVGTNCNSSVTVQSPLTCNPIDNCTIPKLSVGQAVCNGTTYSVPFTVSGGTVSSSTGTISGNSVTGIPVGTNVTITATSGTCVSNIVVTSPTDCKTPCVNPTVSTSEPICSADNMTYSVNYTLTTGATITASVGTVGNGTISGIPAGTAVTITVKLTDCPDKVITIAAPNCVNTPKGSIGDFVFLDNDGSNTQTNGDTPVVGVKVYLLNSAGVKIDSTATGSDGKYLFSNLPLGTYSVQFVAPAGQSFVTANSGTNTALDSDAGTTGKSALISLTANTPNVLTVDAGLKADSAPKGSIGDSVFLDNDGSNTQTTGDTPVAGVKVYLLNSAGVKIDSATTGSDGKYLFSNLPLGTYSIQFVAPAGQSFVTPFVGNDPTKDSDAGISAPVTLTATSPNNSSIDAGVKPLPPCQKPNLTAGNVVCNGATYSISFYSSTTAVTSSAGAISGSSVTGIPVGTNVTLLASVGTGCTSTITVQSPVTCTPSDSCKIPTLNAGQAICNGDTYSVSFNVSGGSMSVSAGTISGNSVIGIPLGTNVTITATSGTCVSNILVTSPTNCKTPCVNPTVSTSEPVCSADKMTYSVSYILNTGATITASAGTVGNGVISGIPTAVDVTITVKLAGCPDKVERIPAPNCLNAPLGSIGDTVFLDNDGSNTQTTGDSPIAGVKVYLLNSTGVKIDSTATGSDGKYLFSNLPLGTYSVQFVAPVGQSFVTALSGTDPTIDSNAGTGGISAPIVLTSTNKDVLTIDAGLKPIPETIDLALKKIVSNKLAKVGDTITYVVKVWNKSSRNATGVAVSDSLSIGIQYLSSVATMGSYDVGTKSWTIGNVAAGDTVTLTMKVKVLAEGVWFNTAQISKADQTDINSTPGNSKDGENDIDRQCFSVPFKLCAGQGVVASLPSNYTGIVWKDGQGNTVPSNNGVVTFTKAGTYTFTATNGSCPTGGCCPVIVEEINCCPAEVCVPFTITKKRIQ